MPTIQEVARRAGVSSGSVSRYLNGHKLKERNERAIEQAIQELGYHPNALARSLRSKRSFSIGLLVNNMLNNFAAQVVAQIEREMELNDYSILLSGFRSDENLFESKLRLMLDRRIDGLIIFEGNAGWPGAQLLEGVDFPVIALSAPFDAPRVDSILVASAQSTQEVVGRMIDCGHERVGIIAGPQDEYVPRERLAGVRAAFDAAGLPRDHARVLVSEDYSRRGGYELMGRLLREGLDAVFVCNYGLSQGALQAVSESGVRIGEDLSYAAYDYFDASSIFYPRLTTIVPPAQEMGSMASHRLLNMIEGRRVAEGRRIFLPEHITMRSSVIGWQG